MSRNSRGGDNKGRSQRRSQNRSKQKFPRGSSEHSENQEPVERESQSPKDQRNQRNKKPIKNARSLRDVVGGHPKGRLPASGPSHPEPRGDVGASSSFAPQGATKKLQYIMNFQPPGAAPRPPSAPPPVRPPIGEYTWPKERTTTSPESPTDEKKNKTFTKSGKRADHTVTGVMKRHPDGYGFLVADRADHPDVYISRQSMLGVMTNDRVEVAVYRPKPGRTPPPKDDRLSGEIVKVLSRANKSVVGRFLPVDQKYGVILDEGRGWGADLRISTKDSMGAQEGQIVAVEVLQYPGTKNEFTGKVIGVIGDLDNPINDVIRVIHQQRIPSEFSALALGEARKFGGQVTLAEIKGREDLTQLPLITIDGATARDFDDAIFTERTASGFRLLVAIADVSHYVKPGTPLDQEAYERGTSTYFPNFVVPMLPEELSNELCSLKPKVKRLCFACDMQITPDGDVTLCRFFEGVMESKARVTYGEAQEVLEAYSDDATRGGSKGRSPTLEKLKGVEENILRSAELAKILMAKRFREGSLDLEIPETQVIVDASGESVDVIKSERLFAHRLIEELMLVTNICTARFMEEKKIPGIYRVHEEPDPENIQSLQRYLWNFGGKKSLAGTSSLQKRLSQALESMNGKPEAQILNILTLRTMRQAHYSQDNVGHFGLGFSQYSHFTSPIRRYPDLIAHRLIKSELYPKYKSMAMTEEDLASASTFLSACEQRSTKAERKVVSIKKARFIRRFIGQEVEGIISSVAKFGVFVLLRQFDVDGLVKVEKLGNDRFEFDDENLRLVGSRTRIQYSIGDAIQVVVVGSDTESGKIDFDLKGASSSEDQEPREKENKKRGAFKGGKSAKGKKQKSQTGSTKPIDVQERSAVENDRRRLRKKRVSKRRGKN